MESHRLYVALLGVILAGLPAFSHAQNPGYYRPVPQQPQSGPPCGHYGTPACPPDPNAPRTTADAPADMTGDALVLYSNDQIRRGDKIGGLKTLERAAAEGNVPAMRGAGMAYVYGQAGVTDVPRGLTLLNKAAATGDGVALFHLGHLYEDGTVVPLNETAAIRDLTASAQKRFWFAEFLLALDYTVGRGVAPNRTTALSYLERAAQDTREETPRNYVAFLRKSGSKHWSSVGELSNDYFADYAKIHTPPPAVRGPVQPGSPEWFARINGSSPYCYRPPGSPSSAPFGCPH